MLRSSLIAALLLTAAAAPLVPPRTTPNYVSEAAPAHSGDTPAPIESLALTAGEPCWIRTSDLLIKSQLLYRLS
jgi:hypothetical protein